MYTATKNSRTQQLMLYGQNPTRVDRSYEVLPTC